MLGSAPVLAVIPARGGSRRLPGKNLLPLAGRPLLAYTIEAARRARAIDRVLVTTDDPAIAEAARALGADVPFLRPAALATDRASSIDVVLHALAALEESYGWVALLQPTSPLRTASDIDLCLAHAHGSGADAVVSVTAPDRSPYLAYQIDPAGRLLPLLAREVAHARTQDLPPTVAPNGAIYAARTDWLLARKSFFSDGETLGFEMPRERSIDIDEALDLRIAEALLTAMPA